MKIYATKASDIQDKDVSEILPLLDSDRRQRVQKIRQDGEKRRCICAGILLRYAFINEGHTNDEWDKISVETGEYGKPFIRLLDGALFNYSISHSGEYVVCAVSDSEVGIDIQQIDVKKPVMKIANRFYADEEYARLEKSQNQINDFYRMWSAKESYVKYTGRGISGGIDKAIVSASFDSINDITDEKNVEIAFYENIDGYIMCACSDDETFPEDFDMITNLLVV